MGVITRIPYIHCVKIAVIFIVVLRMVNYEMKAINNNITKHITQVKEIPGGFDYLCLTCGYHATYTKNGDGTEHLKILFYGTQQENHSEVIDPDKINHLETQVENVLKKHFEAFGEL